MTLSSLERAKQDAEDIRVRPGTIVAAVCDELVVSGPISVAKLTKALMLLDQFKERKK